MCIRDRIYVCQNGTNTNSIGVASCSLDHNNRTLGACSNNENGNNENGNNGNGNNGNSNNGNGNNNNSDPNDEPVAAYGGCTQNELESAVAQWDDWSSPPERFVNAIWGCRDAHQPWGGYDSWEQPSACGSLKNSPTTLLGKCP